MFISIFSPPSFMPRSVFWRRPPFSAASSALLKAPALPARRPCCQNMLPRGSQASPTSLLLFSPIEKNKNYLLKPNTFSSYGREKENVGARSARGKPVWLDCTWIHDRSLFFWCQFKRSIFSHLSFQETQPILVPGQQILEAFLGNNFS